MPKGDATYPTMTIDECLAFADEWSCGMSQQEIAQRWRALCMLLAEEVRVMREMIEAAKAEEREAIFCSVEQTWYAQGLDVRGASVSDFLAAIRARNADKPTGLSERVMTIFAQMQAVSHGRARKG